MTSGNGGYAICWVSEWVRERGRDRQTECKRDAPDRHIFLTFYLTKIGFWATLCYNRSVHLITHRKYSISSFCCYSNKWLTRSNITDDWYGLTDVVKCVCTVELNWAHRESNCQLLNSRTDIALLFCWKGKNKQNEINRRRIIIRREETKKKIMTMTENNPHRDSLWVVWETNLYDIQSLFLKT